MQKLYEIDCHKTIKTFEGPLRISMVFPLSQPLNGSFNGSISKPLAKPLKVQTMVFVNTFQG
jgi:hypothetical protein